METIKVKFVEEQVREAHDNLRGSLLREPSESEVESALKTIAQEKYPNLAIIDFVVTDEPYSVTIIMV